MRSAFISRHLFMSMSIALLLFLLSALTLRPRGGYVGNGIVIHTKTPRFASDDGLLLARVGRLSSSFGLISKWNASPIVFVRSSVRVFFVQSRTTAPGAGVDSKMSLMVVSICHLKSQSVLWFIRYNSARAGSTLRRRCPAAD